MLMNLIFFYLPLASIPLSLLYLVKVKSYLGKAVAAGPTIVFYGLLILPIIIGCKFNIYYSDALCREYGYFFLFSPAVLLWSCLMLIPFLRERRSSN